MSALFGIAIWAVRLDDRLENLSIGVNDIRSNQKEMTYDLKGLHTVVDSIRFSQKLNQAKDEMRDTHNRYRKWMIQV